MLATKNNVWYFNIRLKKIIFGNLIFKSKNIILMKNNVWEFNIQLEKSNIRLKNNIQYSILKSKNLIFIKNNVWEFNIRELIFGKNTLIFLGFVIITGSGPSRIFSISRDLDALAPFTTFSIDPQSLAE